MIDKMSYIVEMTFDNQELKSVTELVYVQKVFSGSAKADMNSM